MSTSNIGIILYRDGSIDYMEVSPTGVFFTTDLAYLKNNEDMGDFGSAERAETYLLLPQAKVWNPAIEFKYYEPWGWGNIVCTVGDLEKFGIDDECDWEIDEGYGVTSTDGLAWAGKQLGYDATLISDVPRNHGWGERFDEYAVYNPAVLRRLYEH